jgi:formiminotetrahydrofolate cyclodeaminase
VSETTIGERSVAGFLDVLASDSPTPGGGAAGGVAGATGAALVGMVARLTAGKKGYEEFDDRMRALAEHADEVRAEFLDLADRDAHAFDGVISAFKMPKETDEQKTTRSAAIQRGYEHAASVPLECLRTAVEALPMAIEATANGNEQATSDGLSAAASLFCAVLCAAANVQINAVALKDEGTRNTMLDEVASLRSRAELSLREAQTAFALRTS